MTGLKIVSDPTTQFISKLNGTHPKQHNLALNLHLL